MRLVQDPYEGSKAVVGRAVEVTDGYIVGVLRPRHPPTRRRHGTGRKKRGRPKRKFMEVVKEDLCDRGY